MSEYLSVNEVSKLLVVSRKTAYEKVEAEKFPSIRDPYEFKKQVIRIPFLEFMNYVPDHWEWLRTDEPQKLEQKLQLISQRYELTKNAYKTGGIEACHKLLYGMK